ncbi:class I SAM-dependent methyltransferase [Anabaena sp. UHCC 0187]|uniref:class I SAM-dependent methyltransferase n=1 Tax=Anabaena sp. UHCC 0187 TaxID=2590018 RepID=UPI0014468D0F|nr:methyltransferase domain-containing protein [Anabaena sp. UHCC 0187]MTJ13434.1 class I SAM-dependent methyltransferase [Anabaena sp. UHCC 0187]
MTNDMIAYTSDYFQSIIFDTDYQALALHIVEIYHPKTVVEFGCGPGHLSRELAKLGVQMTSVDGYSQPDFTGLSVEFYPLNLNDATAIANLFQDKHFDLAISLEVAEHLQPESSPTVINWLTKVAPVVVFSAAVPSQGGHGHINLHPRDYWHRLFTECNFVISDRIREKLRNHPTVAPWYRYNVLDYVHANHPQVPQLNEVITRLIASESAAATGYYEESTKLYQLEQKTGICN